MLFRTRPLMSLLPALLLAGCATQESEQAAGGHDDASHSHATYALCAAIPEDRVDDWKAMIDQANARSDEHRAANSAAGVEHEIVWMQEMPEGGAAAVVYFEGHDLDGFMGRRSAATDEYSQWFLSQITDIHGLPEDLSQMPTNEMVMQGDVSGVEGETQTYALGAPILPGKEDAHAAFIAAIKGERHSEWEASRRSRGIAKEYVWNQTNPDGSVVTVVFFEITDPANLNNPPEGEFEEWFRQQILDIHGIPLDAPMPANMIVAQF